MTIYRKIWRGVTTIGLSFAIGIALSYFIAKGMKAYSCNEFLIIFSCLLNVLTYIHAGICSYFNTRYYKVD
jgi:hypothetical protein